MNNHSWNPLPGFRVSQCRNCGCIKRWDAGYKKTVYDYGTKTLFKAPDCISAMHCDTRVKTFSVVNN